MTLNKLRNILNNNTGNIYKNLRKLKKIPYKVYNNYELQNNSKNYNNSSNLSLSVLDILLKNNIDADVNVTHLTHSKHHVYLTTYINDNNKLNKIIIDPSYKKFLIDNRGEDDNYQNKLSKELNEIYTGTKVDLMYLLLEMKNLNKSIYGNSIINVDEIFYYYNNSRCYTQHFKNNLLQLKLN